MNENTKYMLYGVIVTAIIAIFIGFGIENNKEIVEQEKIVEAKKSFETMFNEKFMPSCIETAKEYVEDADAFRYCDCASKEMLNKYSRSEIIEMSENYDLMGDLPESIDVIIDYCADKI